MMRVFFIDEQLFFATIILAISEVVGRCPANNGILILGLRVDRKCESKMALGLLTPLRRAQRDC